MLSEKLPVFSIVVCILFCFPAILSLLGIEVDDKACRKLCNLHPLAAVVWIAIMSYVIWINIKLLRKAKGGQSKKSKRRN